MSGTRPAGSPSASPAADQSLRLLQAPEAQTVIGKRDRAILAVLLGCGLRRAEVAKLQVRDVQQREEHWAVVDLIGKGRHIRTVPIPDWVKASLDVWTEAAMIVDGRLFRCVSRTGSVWGDGITEKVIWHTVKKYAAIVGIRQLAPHDCRRYAESRTMPNRDKGSSFGGELGARK